MLIKKGAKGRNVKEIQTLLDFHGFWTYHKITDYFGDVTEEAVKNFQRAKGLDDDGAVGDLTLAELLEGVDADDYTIDDEDKFDNDNICEDKGSYTSPTGLEIHRYYLDDDEYVKDYGKIEPRWFFIHHTAGGHNPFRTISNWNKDTRGRVATQYCIGGISTKNGDDQYDGVVVECFPDNYIGWHLGKVGNFNMSKFSTAVEINNYGYLTKKGDKFYNAYGGLVPEDMVCDLGYKFKGRQYWHKYTDKQMEALEGLIKHIAHIYPRVPLVSGMPQMLKDGAHPRDVFAFKEDAYNGKVEGTWSHTSVRTGKMDVYPDPRLVEILKKL
jgi:N-acetyl-anhydromuramyl-L-alanine amidase AmpD